MAGKPTGRGKVARGIGKGGAPGYKTASAGKGNGGKVASPMVPKGRQPKNMGSSGSKETGPKYGRGTGKKVY